MIKLSGMLPNIQSKNRKEIISNITTNSQSFISLIKTQVKKFIPFSYRATLRLIPVLPLALKSPILASNYAYDFKRFLRNSTIDAKIRTKTQMCALITMDYHRIEKGLALKNPRLGFGSEIIDRLISNLKQYCQKYGIDETVQFAINTLSAYYEFNLKQGLDNQQLYQEINTLKSHDISYGNTLGGVMEVTKDQILAAVPTDYRAFTESRYSVRNFAPIEVDIKLIKTAIAIAQKTPSVCNRQSAKVHIYSDPKDKEKVLSFQNGNRGFGDQASKVLIVTSDLQHFISVGERNQCWIDGGMFAMSLVYALHSLGLGTCCLNWSVDFLTDRNLKKNAGISDSESIMMMIAVGHLPNKFKVAQSPRKNIDEVMILH